MSSKSNFRDPDFWVIIIILLFAVHLNAAIYLGKINLNFKVLSARFPHLLATLSMVLIAAFTPIFYILKRRKPTLYKQLLKSHMFGNTLALLMISVHLVFRSLRRPLGVGAVLFIISTLLVLSGISFKFNLLKPLMRERKNIPHYNRFFHVSLTISFYLVLIFHLFNVL